MAQNTKTCDYVKCAKVLSESIKRVMPNAEVTVAVPLLPLQVVAHVSESLFIAPIKTDAETNATI